MDGESFRKLASKLGITSPKVLSQAEEYMRLSQVKCTGLGGSTASSKAVICLELAATAMKCPIDKLKSLILELRARSREAHVHRQSLLLSDRPSLQQRLGGVSTMFELRKNNPGSTSLS
ncbi:hypothetical protein PDJAM_G00150750 [Pangasius djambal]|uniref:Uncharacterized protein n=1 Tax=Pangasius djambal TaxID=1691987 RepID=A0ACC5ZHE4_9TELE|nr:hypothetical protein [Pangasius djambal]